MLTLENLSFERNNKLLFSNIHCFLEKGELLQVNGANGSGKSTLLRIIAGFIEPLTGTIRWKNQSIRQDRYSFQQQLNYIGHQSGVKHYLTVQENLQTNCMLTANKRSFSYISKVIERLELNSILAHQAQTLSAGQLRRLALARLLLNPVSLWILDEPIAALDRNGQALLIELLKEHLDAGGLAIVATHQALQKMPIIKTIELGHGYV